jgi:hypothetical protein
MERRRRSMNSGFLDNDGSGYDGTRNLKAGLGLGGRRMLEPTASEVRCAKGWHKMGSHRGRFCAGMRKTGAREIGTHGTYARCVYVVVRYTTSRDYECQGNMAAVLGARRGGALK